jgi:polyhydroxyalkanoate synthase subunit PhaE
MSDETRKETPLESMFAEWTKSPANFMSLLSMFSKPSAPSGASPGQAGKSRTIESWESMMKMWHLTTSTMSDPDSAELFLKGAGALPDIVMKVAQAGWDASVEMQRKVIEKAGKIGQRTEAYNFDQLDEGLFKAWKEIYEQELSQFLKIPNLGLARYYQDRLYQLMDRYNVFEATFSEFLYIIYQPVEKSKKVLEEKLQQMAIEGNVPEKSKELYNMFIKILEGHYMTLFKTPEYEKVLREMLSQLNAFWLAKDEVLRDVLQVLPVPTNKDMDVLYKDIYLLKKRVRSLEDELKNAKKQQA